MVLLKRNKDLLLIAAEDELLQYNFENKCVQILKIPEPILSEILTERQIQVLKNEIRTVTSVEFSNSAEYIAISTQNKQVIVCDINLNVLKNIIINRAASKVCFTPRNDILIADKTGDVFLFPFTKENCEVSLLLGHLSVVLDVLVSACGKFIITCDRDEKIRVSCMPNAYNIASFCLGHKEFVTNIKLVKNVLISASGDGTIRFWNYLKGVELGLIDTSNIYDKYLLKHFSEQMDAEKVDVLTLPITDLQICSTGDDVLIAVSLYKSDSVFVYNVNMTTLKSDFVTSIPAGSQNFSFCFSDSNLYILGDKFYQYKLIKNRLVEENEGLAQVLDTNLNRLLKIPEDNSITALYKRKFDNVQEYLQRKRQRLEGKI